MKNSDLFINEHEYSDLHSDKAISHLCDAIRFKTVSYVDISKVDFGEFDKFHEYIKSSFPLVISNGTYEEVGHSILITLPGSDSSLRPALFMAHQDVVPIVKNSENNWMHDPFGGDVADGFIWGRGAMDIKQMLIAILEAAEYLLSAGKRFKRTVYLAFGEDEETKNTGARAISNLLKSRKVTLEYVLDESGGDVIEASDLGAPGKYICPIGICEKGYADLKLSVCSRGGHSSNPFHGTSLGVLAKAITDVLDNPLPESLPGCVRQTLETLKDDITSEPMASYVKDIEANEGKLIDYFKSKESLYYLVQTTAAPTMITEGSPAGNVMPQDMSAVINFRLSPPDTPESLLEHYRSVVDKDVKLELVQKIAPSIPSDTDAPGYKSLRSVLEHYFADLIFVPILNRGSTDARHYEQICRCCLRFGPFLEEEDISAEGIHGTNERISVRAYLQGIRVIIKLMETTCL